jgi:hypothetical protein
MARETKSHKPTHIHTPSHPWKLTLAVQIFSELNGTPMLRQMLGAGDLFGTTPSHFGRISIFSPAAATLGVSQAPAEDCATRRLCFDASE